MSDVRSARPLRESSSGASRRGAPAAAAAPASRLALELAAAALEVPAQRGRGLVAQRHDAHLAALAAHDELRLGRLDVAQAQRHQLHAAQAAPVEELEDEPVAQRQRVGAVRGRHQRVDLASG